MTQTVQTIVQQFLDRVRQTGILVSHAYVFGSHAKGTATETSDIDVCIVSPHLGKDPIAEMVKLRQLAYPIDSRIEPIPLSDEGFNDPYSTLVSEIRRYGKPLAVTRP